MSNMLQEIYEFQTQNLGKRLLEKKIILKLKLMSINSQ